jgi:hypothetical protein
VNWVWCKARFFLNIFPQKLKTTPITNTKVSFR